MISSRPRDYQRSKVYKSEGQCVDIDLYEIRDIKEISRFCFQIFSAESLSLPSFEVKSGRGSRWARGCRDFIKLPRWARKKMIILHELAHTIAEVKYPNKAGHGPEFCGVFLMLLLKYMDDSGKSHSRLKYYFDKNKVDYIEVK